MSNRGGEKNNWVKPKADKIKILEPEGDGLGQMIKALKRIENKPGLEAFSKELKSLIWEEIKLNKWGNEQ